MDSSKIRRELGWQPKESFESGLAKTVRWYLENDTWLSAVTDAWVDEAERRWQARLDGTIASRPADEAIEEARKKLR
jgi:hypothetical protein